MPRKHLLFKVHVLLLFVSLSLYFSRVGLAQDGGEKVPKEQAPVQERDPGDSFIENLGEVPGKIVTLPFTLLFTGLAKTAGFLVDHNVYLRVTDWLTNEDGTRKVRPVFTPPSGGGVTFKQENLFTHGMTFRAQASLGTRTRRYLGGSLTDLQLFSSRVGMKLIGFQHRKPDEDFFGLGNGSLEGDETNYLLHENNFEVDLLATPFDNTQFFVGVSYSDVNIERGRDPNQPSIEENFGLGQVPGFFGTEMWSLLFKYYHDSRNVTGHPIRGGEEYVSVEFARQVGGDEFGYRQYIVDLRRYVQLFHRRVLAFRLRGEVTDNMSGRDIPFYRLPGLGKQDVLSGYRPVRFRDNDLMLAGLEYRFPIHGAAVTTLFVEEGRVFSNLFDEFSLSDWKYSFGGGFRIIGFDGALITSLGIARSAEQTRFVFGLNAELRSF